MNTAQIEEQDDVQVAGGMSPDALVRALAEVLCETIRESDLDYLEKEPEDAYIDLANNLIVKLAHRQITIVSVFQHLFGQAALRIFKNFTTCLARRPELAFNLQKNGKFKIVAAGPNGKTQAFCSGDDAYDACAQLAHVISTNGGSL